MDSDMLMIEAQMLRDMLVAFCTESGRPGVGDWKWLAAQLRQTVTQIEALLDAARESSQCAESSKRLAQLLAETEDTMAVWSG